MRQISLLIVLTLLTSPVLAGPPAADHGALITAQMQKMADALVSGDARPWDKYLDPGVTYAEEDGSYKGKTEMLKEVRPLPKGLGGAIRMQLLSYREDGDVAVALFRQNETEHYFGQTIYAKYLTNTTWRERAGGWKLIAAQVLAEKTDPPAIALTPKQIAQYVGTYRLRNSEPTYTLALDNGALVGTRNGRKPAVWNAEAADVFFIKGDPRIRKIFQRDASGRITGFVERRESWDIVWDRLDR
jgi:hypothetical protein